MVPNLVKTADYIKSDINETLYESSCGPITSLDMIYGYREFTKSGMNGMMHKIGFTPKLMKQVLDFCKFSNKTYTVNFDIVAVLGNLENCTLIEKSLESYYGSKISNYLL